jgi:hypothetical protein
MKHAHYAMLNIVTTPILYSSLGSCFLQVECGPVYNVEDDEDDWKGDEDGHVHLAGLVLLHRSRDLPKRVDLHLKMKTVLPVSESNVKRKVDDSAKYFFSIKINLPNAP